MERLQEKHSLVNESCAVAKVAFSPSSQVIACGRSDGAVRSFRLPISRHEGKGRDLFGHDRAITSVSWSNGSHSALRKRDGKGGWGKTMLLSGSADGTARAWCAFKSEPLFRIVHSDSVTASFFYMDKFILVSCGSSVFAYSYALDENLCNAKDDIARQQTDNRVTFVKEWNFAPAQHVTSFSAINSFLSHLVVVALSDKTVQVVDVAADKAVRMETGSLNRPASFVALPTSCNYASHPQSAYDTFLTSSSENGGTLSLWDLRSKSVVSTFTGHKNFGKQCGAAFSPCLRYIASGSEDNACCVYDVRRGDTAMRLMGQHRAAVLDVAYNPLHPQMVTAGADGKVRFYAAH